MGDILIVRRGFGQCQGVGRDGGCMGAQEPSTCFLYQEGVCFGDGRFLEGSGKDSLGTGHQGPQGVLRGAGAQGRQGKGSGEGALTTLCFSDSTRLSSKLTSPWWRAMTTKAVSATVSSLPTKPPWSEWGEEMSGQNWGAVLCSWPGTTPYLHAPVDHGLQVLEGAIGLLLGEEPLGGLLQLLC